jgi:hypothetical protein
MGNFSQLAQCIETKDELDRIRKKQRAASKKAPRASVLRINLGNTHSRIPSGTLYPFMVSQDWYEAAIDGKPELEAVFSLYNNNPQGFGEDGYTGDDEGTR